MCDTRPTATLSITGSPDAFKWHMSESLDAGAGCSIGMTTLNKPVAAINIVKRRNFTASNLAVIGAVSPVLVKKPDCRRSRHPCRMSLPGRLLPLLTIITTCIGSLLRHRLDYTAHWYAPSFPAPRPIPNGQSQPPRPHPRYSIPTLSRRREPSPAYKTCHLLSLKPTA